MGYLFIYLNYHDYGVEGPTAARAGGVDINMDRCPHAPGVRSCAYDERVLAGARQRSSGLLRGNVARRQRGAQWRYFLYFNFRVRSNITGLSLRQLSYEGRHGYARTTPA